MARNDAESESEGSDQLRSALMEFTTKFYKTNPTAQFDTRSIMSGLTDGFKKMKETTKATASAMAASPHTSANMLATSAPNAADIVAISKHVATATLANCDDVIKGYAADDHFHALLLSVKTSENNDAP